MYVHANVLKNEQVLRSPKNLNSLRQEDDRKLFAGISQDEIIFIIIVHSNAFTF